MTNDKIMVCGLMRTGKHFVRDVLGALGITTGGNMSGVSYRPGRFPSKEPQVLTYDIDDGMTKQLRSSLEKDTFKLAGIIFTQRNWDHLYESHARRGQAGRHYNDWFNAQNAQKGRFEAFLSAHPQIHVEHLWSPEEAKDWRELSRAIRAFLPEIPEEKIEKVHGELFKPIMFKGQIIRAGEKQCQPKTTT